MGAGFMGAGSMGAGSMGAGAGPTGAGFIDVGLTCVEPADAWSWGDGCRNAIGRTPPPGTAIHRRSLATLIIDACLVGRGVYNAGASDTT